MMPLNTKGLITGLAYAVCLLTLLGRGGSSGTGALSADNPPQGGGVPADGMPSNASVKSIGAQPGREDGRRFNFTFPTRNGEAPEADGDATYEPVNT